MGRRRVEIKRIEDKARMQTTFTKRHQGLVKKAGEYAHMYGAKAAIISFSHAGNCYAFGNPSVDEVVKLYLKTRNAVRNSPDNIREDLGQLNRVAENPLAQSEPETEREVGEIRTEELMTDFVDLGNEKVTADANNKKVDEDKSIFRALLESEIKNSNFSHLQKLNSELEDLKVTLEMFLGS